MRGLFDNFGPTPIKVLLSDHLGEAGITRVTNGVPSLGVLVEVSSPAAIGDANFQEVLNKSPWDPGATINPMIRYVNGVTWTSEWSKYRVKDGGVDVALPAKPRARRL